MTDLEFSSLTATLVLLTTITAIIIWWSVSPFTFFAKCNVSGPRPWPFVGNVIHLYGGKNTFHKTVMEMIRQYGDVFCWYEGRAPFITITDPKLLKEILIRHFSKFQDRNSPLKNPRGVKGLLFMEGKRWKEMRTLLSPTFSSGKIKEMSNLVNDITSRLLDILETCSVSGNPVNVRRVFGNYALDVIASVAFGIDIVSQTDLNNQFAENARNMLSRLPGRMGVASWFLATFPMIRFLAERIAAATERKPLQFFDQSLDEVLAVRQASGSERRDFLQVLLEAAENHIMESNDSEPVQPNEREVKLAKAKEKTTLSRAEIKAQLMLFLLAGYETSALTLSYCTYLLARHPEVQDKLIKEVDHVLEGESKLDYNSVNILPYLDMVISETLRLYPPAHRFNRVCLESCIIDGIHFRKGVTVDIPVYAIHHNPKFWPDPENFNPERFIAVAKAERDPYTFLPFSHGPRNCIGMKFAQMEIKIALSRLLQKYKFITCTETEIPLALELRTVLYPKNDVFLTIVKRD